MGARFSFNGRWQFVHVVQVPGEPAATINAPQTQRNKVKNAFRGYCVTMIAIRLRKSSVRNLLLSKRTAEEDDGRSAST